MTKSYIFFSPIAYRPTGGIGFIYRIVDFLNESHIPASVFHVVKSFECDWIDHGRHIHSGKLNPSFHHIVLAENEVLEYASFLTENNFKYSILVQNGYYIPDAIDANNDSACDSLIKYYKNADYIFSVSDYTTKLIHQFFGDEKSVIRLITTPYLVDFSIPAEKKKIISFMSRKNSINVNRVIFGLYKLKTLGWSLIDINSNGPMSEDNLKKTLSESAIFLSFGTKRVCRHHQ